MKYRNITFLFAILLLSCNSTGVESLNTTIVKYADLPIGVKKVMFASDYVENDGKVSLNLYTELNEISKYDYMSKQHTLMPWVHVGQLVRKSDKKEFELNFSTEHSSKYVVYNDYLYVPRHYNIYMKDSLKYSFSRFKLD